MTIRTSSPEDNASVAICFCESLRDLREKISNLRFLKIAGYSELDETDAAKVTISHMQCGAEWNVPGNEYWVYEPVRQTGTISATLPFTLPVLAGYNYAIEITLAPDTERNDTLPT